jgi:hypothetical protein
MSPETTQVAFLMEVGWTLLVPKDPEQPPRLTKAVTTGQTTEVKFVQVSRDTVIELSQLKKLKKRKQFTVQHRTTVVYELKQ